MDSSTWHFQSKSPWSKQNLGWSTAIYPKSTWITRHDKKNSNTEGKKRKSKSSLQLKKWRDSTWLMRKKNSITSSNSSINPSKSGVSLIKSKFSWPKSADSINSISLLIMNYLKLLPGKRTNAKAWSLFHW